MIKWRLILISAIALKVFGLNTAWAGSESKISDRSTTEALERIQSQLHLIDDRLEYTIEDDWNEIARQTRKGEQAVFHLPQQHRTSSEALMYYVFHSTAASQYRIYRVLSLVKAAGIQANYVDEGQGVSLTAEEKRRGTVAHLVQLAKQRFPSGVPLKFSELTPLQLEFLAVVGGLRTAYLLDQAANLESDGRGLLNLDGACGVGPFAMSNPDPKCRDFIFADRENSVVEKVTQIFQTEPTTQAVFVSYGSNHDFEPEFQAAGLNFTTLHSGGYSISKIDEIVQEDCPRSSCGILTLRVSEDLVPVLLEMNKQFGVVQSD